MRARLERFAVAGFATEGRVRAALALARIGELECWEGAEKERGRLLCRKTRKFKAPLGPWGPRAA